MSLGSLLGGLGALLGPDERLVGLGALLRERDLARRREEPARARADARQRGHDHEQQEDHGRRGGDHAQERPGGRAARGDALVALIDLDRAQRAVLAQSQRHEGGEHLAVVGADRADLAAAAGRRVHGIEIAAHRIGPVAGVGREEQVARGRPHAHTEGGAVGEHTALQAAQQVARDVAVDGAGDVGGHQHRGHAGVREPLRGDLRLRLGLLDRSGAEEGGARHDRETEQQQGDGRPSPPADRVHRAATTHAC